MYENLQGLIFIGHQQSGKAIFCDHQKTKCIVILNRLFSLINGNKVQTVFVRVLNDLCIEDKRFVVKILSINEWLIV